MKTNIGLVIGTAIAALGIAIAAVPEAKAGGVYWINNGGGGVVVNRGYHYSPRGYYNYGSNYYGRRRVVWSERRLCPWLLRSRRMYPLLSHHPPPEGRDA